VFRFSGKKRKGKSETERSGGPRTRVETELALAEKQQSNQTRLRERKKQGCHVQIGPGGFTRQTRVSEIRAFGGGAGEGRTYKDMTKN